LERGSSSDSLREDDIPEGDELGERSLLGVEDAREASSSESRGWRGDIALSLEYPFRGISAFSCTYEQKLFRRRTMSLLCL